MSPDTHDQAARHDPVYDRLAASPQFSELRSRYRKFIVPATVAFLAWYFFYVLLSMFAPGLMTARVLGNVNVALVLGLLQFATTFLIAWLYSRYSTAKLDPLARQLDDEYTANARPADGSHGTTPGAH